MSVDVSQSMMALRVSDVTADSIREALLAPGVETSWHDACHVTPAGRLAFAIGRLRGAATPLGTLIDIIVSQGLPGQFRAVAPVARQRPGVGASEREFKDEWTRYKQAVQAWRSRASGAKVRLHLHELESITKSIRKCPSGVREALWHGRHDLLASLRALSSSGVQPDEVDGHGDTVIEAAKGVWVELERDVPAFTQVRADIWHDQEAMRQQTTEEARFLKQRIQAAFAAAFGTRPEQPTTLVYHGFYFYTPLQWRFFQLLGSVQGIRQVFIVHDDGRSPVFESWRHYFAKSVGMPEPGPVTKEPARQTAAAQVLDQALRGERVRDPGATSLRVAVYEDMAGFVSGLVPGQQHFAAEHEDLMRKVSRLSTGIRSEKAPLGSLPVGQFLVSLHQCVQTSADRSGAPRLVLTPQLLVELCASGFLHFGFPAAELLSTLERALPFFAGCEAARDWVLRADHLRKLLPLEVHPLGAKPDDPPKDALDDLSTRVENELRLAPWCDLSELEANRLHRVIDELVALLESLFAREQIALKDHFRFIGAEVRDGLDAVHPADRAAIEDKLDTLAAGLDGNMSVETIVDVVQIVVGRETEFDEDASGFRGDPDKEGGKASEIHLPEPLRNLDALVLDPPKAGVIISNLHDTAFPMHASAVPWPFNIESLPKLPTHVRRLFLLREQIAPLGDLYLLWLGMCGCEKGVTVNWIRRLDGESRNPSTAVSLLLANDRHRDGDATDTINVAAGGVPLFRASELKLSTSKPSSITISRDAKLDKHAEKLISGDPKQLNLKVVAHAVACPRRLALQWILGDSAAFVEGWHHARMFGTMWKRLTKRHEGSGVGIEEAERRATESCNDLFRFLTPGERMSSARLARATNQPWSLFLWGSRDGDDNVSRAYRAAYGGTVLALDVVAPQPAGATLRALPPGKRTEPPAEDEYDDKRHKDCMWCPMANRCLERVRQEW